MEARGPDTHEPARRRAALMRRRAKARRANLIVAAVAAVAGFGVVAFAVWALSTADERAPSARTEQARPAAAATPAAAAEPAAAPRDESFFSQIFEEGSPAGPAGDEHADWLTTFARVTVRLTLAALLTALLAFRPRRFSLFFKRNPFVAQTQILLSVVASALMMIVGDSAARAFGIFAAVSLVRFRTNIKDPKEITVLLVSLAVGLATGVGRWELAIILSFFVLLLLWGLEYRETEQVTREMELTVKTRDVDATQVVLLELFRKYGFDSEVRTIDHPDAEGEIGCVVYHVSISPFVSIDRLSEEILTADESNVDSVEWDQQKNTSYFYQ